MHRIDGAGAGAGGGSSEKGAHRDAEARFLASILPAAESTPSSVSKGLPAASAIGDKDPTPSTIDMATAMAPLPLVADGRPNANTSRRDDQNRQISSILEKALGFFERMRGIGVEEAAAVGAEFLDRFLARHGPIEMICLAPSSVVASTAPVNVCGAPSATSAMARRSPAATKYRASPASYRPELPTVGETARESRASARGYREPVARKGSYGRSAPAFA